MNEILGVCGRNIRRYRKEKGLTIEQMSHGLNITGAYLGYLERGQRNPSLLTLAKIAHTLGVPPHLLLRATGDRFEEKLYELMDILYGMRDTKQVVFLKEVLQSYIKLSDIQRPM